MPIFVTKVAAERFQAALSSEGLEDHAIRVLAERRDGGRIIYGLDFCPIGDRQPDDSEVSAFTVRFFLEAAVVELIRGTTIDYVEREDGSAGFKFEHPEVVAGWPDPVAGKLQQLLDQNINPAIASHGGRVELLRVDEGTAFVKMHGGCQGCGMAAVTLRDGIERQVFEAMPEITKIVDTTDHDSGVNPYYAP